LPVRSSRVAFTWYADNALTRTCQTSLASPMDTKTSVWMKSTPSTASAGSFGEGDPRSGTAGDVLGCGDDVHGWLEVGGAGQPDVAPHQRAHEQQRPAPC
jgi:hypothetical protein